MNHMNWDDVLSYIQGERDEAYLRGYKEGLAAGAAVIRKEMYERKEQNYGKSYRKHRN